MTDGDGGLNAGRQDNRGFEGLAITPDGLVTFYTSKVELGTGTITALAQIVAEELDVPFTNIKMVQGDTSTSIEQGSTVGSRTIERTRAEEERQAHLGFLESMDQVNRAIQGTNDVEQMMSDVLELVLEMERRFGVSITDDETGQRVLRSVDTIADFIVSERARKSA